MTSGELLDLIRARVGRTTHVDDVSALIEPYASDSAWVYLGGSGARQRIFRLPENLRAAFAFDGDDRLVAYAAYESKEPWTPEGMLPVDPEVTLNFV